MEHLIAPAINLALLLIFLGVKLRQPLQEFISNRHVQVGDQIRSVAQLLQEAERRHQEMKVLLASLDREVVGIRQQAERDSAIMKDRMISEATQLAERIARETKDAAAAVHRDWVQNIARELGAKVVERAEGLLRARLTGDDKSRLRKEFWRQLEAAS